jgi:hypothetical protein
MVTLAISIQRFAVLECQPVSPNQGALIPAHTKMYDGQHERLPFRTIAANHEQDRMSVPLARLVAVLLVCLCVEGEDMYELIRRSEISCSIRIEPVHLI